MTQFRQVAGCYGSRFPTGAATTMSPEDLDILADALQQPSDELQTAIVFLSLAQLEMLHSQHPRVSAAGAALLCRSCACSRLRFPSILFKCPLCYSPAAACRPCSAPHAFKLCTAQQPADCSLLFTGCCPFHAGIVKTLVESWRSTAPAPS